MAIIRVDEDNGTRGRKKKGHREFIPIWTTRLDHVRYGTIVDDYIIYLGERGSKNARRGDARE